MIALVRGVIAASICSGSMLKVSSSTSTNTGLAPTCKILLAEAINVNGVVITSSPAPMACASKIVCKAVVPEEVAMAWRVPHRLAKLASSSATRGP